VRAPIGRRRVARPVGPGREPGWLSRHGHRRETVWARTVGVGGNQCSDLALPPAEVLAQYFTSAPARARGEFRLPGGGTPRCPRGALPSSDRGCFASSPAESCGGRRRREPHRASPGTTAWVRIGRGHTCGAPCPARPCQRRPCPCRPQ
jgi:hypothetical protein